MIGFTVLGRRVLGSRVIGFRVVGLQGSVLRLLHIFPETRPELSGRLITEVALSHLPYSQIHYFR